MKPRHALTALLCAAIVCGVCSALQAQQKEIDRLNVDLENTKEDTAKVNLLNALAMAYVNRDADTASSYAHRAQKLAETIDYPQGIARSLNHLGLLRSRQGAAAEALALYRQSLALSVDRGEKNDIAVSHSRIATVYTEQGRYAKATEHYTSSLRIWKDLGKQRSIANCLNNLGNINYLTHSPRKAEKYYRQSLRIFEELNDLPGLSVTHGSLGILTQHFGRTEEAIIHFRESLRISEMLGDQHRRAKNLLNIGVLLDRSGSLAESLKRYQESLHIYENLGNKRAAVLCRMNIGAVLQKQGRYAMALDHFMQSLDIMQSLGDRPSIAMCYWNIGVIFGHKGKHTEALRHFQKSRSMYEEIEDKRGMARSLLKIAEMNRKLRKSPEVVLKSLQSCLNIFEELENQSGIADVTHEIGILYRECGMYWEAIPYHERSIKLMNELGEREKLAYALCDLGWDYHFLGDYSTALAKMEQGLELAEELHATEATSCVLSRVHKLYAESGDFQRAYEYHQRRIRHRDSIRTTQEKLQLRELMEKYESEQRQREIERLEKEKALQSLELLQRSEALRRAQQETEIHHLESRMAAAQLQSKEAEGLRQQQQIDLLEKDRKLQAASLEQETLLRNSLIGTALLLLIIGLLVFRRMRDRRRTMELKAQVAETHAQTADMEKLRIQAEAERKEKESQRMFARGLLEAQEAERKRLAGELHDSLGQDLIVVKNRLLLLRETAPVDGDLDEAIAGVGETLEDVRRLSRDLRPYQLDRYGIGKALHALIDRADESSRVRFTAEIDEVDGIWSKDTEVCIYRIVQEGISNILKHAQAEHAHIRLLMRDDGISLLMEDNGTGLPKALIDGSLPTGFGLKGMAERSEILGGEMNITSSPGNGTRIEMRLPLPVTATETTHEDGNVTSSSEASTTTAPLEQA